MLFLRLAQVCLLLAPVLCRPSAFAATNCDNSHCKEPQANKLNVHLVPHTHDDVGWLKTVDQYYYGSNTKYQKAGVQYIIDSVVNSLLNNENRKFIYVETAFFWKWWKEQTPELQAKVKDLVNNGRLEFINGGWCMNDEAATHYNQIIDQMTWGHRRLQDTFGQCGVPKIGWQIDPFGHSREQANLFAQMGFDGVFFARLDYEDKRKRDANKTMELVWQGSDDLGSSSDIFTHAMDMGYGPPPGFNWDLTGSDEDPFIDDPEVEDYNVDKIVDRFIDFAKQYSQIYATNNLLFPMGTDFQYQDANVWFKNMDKLIKYVNQRQAKGSNVNVFYSTPTCYLHGVSMANHTFTTKSDDFFPYASDPHSYWTGYFTSRPAVKKLDKVGNNFLQVCKQLDVLSQKGEKEDKIDLIADLREWMGVLQHHDAVAGTEKQHVANNYVLKVDKAIQKCKTVVNESLNKLLSKRETKTEQTFCQALNVSACAATEGNDSVAVTIYNPLGHSVTKLVRLPITNKNYQVLDQTGSHVIRSWIAPIPAAVIALKERVSKATEELLFEVDVPALGFVTVILKAKGDTPAETAKVSKISDEVVVKSEKFNVVFDKTGKLSAIQTKSGKNIQLTQEFDFYKAMPGDNKGADHRASGAYIFRPDGQTPNPYNQTAIESQLVETSYVTEVHQKINDFVSQVIRVRPNADIIEFDYVVGPIPVDDKVGKELISRFYTNLTTNGVFYTDANGRQLLKRVRNSRPTWNLTVTEPIAGNYYPINSRIGIRDEKQDIQITVLNDRSQGGSSIVDGSVELMIHRRDLFDDAFGVSEALNEPGVDGKGLVIRGHLVLVASGIAEAADLHRQIAQRIFLEPLITFSAVKTGSEEDYYKSHNTYASGLTQDLPKNVHLLTLEQWKDNQYLLRLEHYFQQNESQTLSTPVKVELKNLFKGFTITEALETSLTATLDKQTVDRLKFKSDADPKRFEPQKSEFNKSDLTVTLNPMEIKTFIVKTKAN